MNADEGFFRERHISFRKKLTNNDVNSFASLLTDKARFEFVNGLAFAHDNKIGPSATDKSVSAAKLLKDDGNRAFQSGEYNIALTMYNKSLIKSPIGAENAVDASIIRANRSAALYHLKEFKPALNDIEMAIQLGYPKDLLYKVKDRKAQCLLALKQHKSALQAFRETLTALDDAKVPTAQRQKKQKDVQIMIAMLTNNDAKNAQICEEKAKSQTVEKCNPVFKAASEAVQIKQADVVGRYAEAKRSIRIGEVILTERPHTAVLLEQYALTNCFQCFKGVEVAEPCPNCGRVVFCSSRCLKTAMATHHKVECSILPSLWESGISITCLMALRIISQKTPDYFARLTLEDTSEVNKTSLYNGDDYSTVYNLVRHQERRSVEDFLHRAHLAVFLFQCLKETGYFKLNETTAAEAESRENLIGGLLLRNLQILQFNAHEVSELQIEGGSLDKCKSVFLGGAVYPTLALFNHSCNPSIVRYFQGTSVVARAVKNIEKGEMIAENYGPIFTQTRKPERQQILKSQYWFDCRCQPCLEDWPVIDQMEMDILRFRCEQKGKCNNVIIVPIDTMDFMIKCDICDQHTNILKGLKVLQDTETLFRLARSYKGEGKFAQALKKFLELFTLLDETLAPPFKDYHICQEEIRTCYLALGNKKEKPTHK